MDGVMAKPLSSALINQEIARLFGISRPLAGDTLLDRDTLDSHRHGLEPVTFSKVVDDFRAHSRDYLPALRQAVTAGDAEGVVRTAHRLGGVAGLLGLHRLSELCTALERGYREMDDAGSREAVANLEEVYDATVQALARYTGE